MSRRTLDASATAEVVQSLLQHGVHGPSEAAARLKGVDRTVARRLATERLARGDLPDTALETLVNVFSALGLCEEREALRGIVLSPSQPEEIRNCAVLAQAEGIRRTSV